MRRALLICLLLPMHALAQDAGEPSPAPRTRGGPAIINVETLDAGVKLPDGGVKPDAAPVLSVVAVVSMAVTAPPSGGQSLPPSIPGIVVPPSLPGEDFSADQAIAAYKASREAIKAPTAFGVASALTMLIFLSVGFLRKYGGKLQTDARVKRFIAFAVAAAGGLAMVAPGMSWAQAAFIAGAPILAMGVYEFTKSSKS